MTSSNGNIFRVTGPLCGDFTHHGWIPRKKASDAEFWFFLSAPEQIVEKTIGDLRRRRAHYDVTVIIVIIVVAVTIKSHAHFMDITAAPDSWQHLISPACLLFNQLIALGTQ